MFKDLFDSLLQGLRSVGLGEKDPRLQASMTKIRKLQNILPELEGKEMRLDKESFKE